jgi:predicted Mrr-cat superfamily restriction endonuclease
VPPAVWVISTERSQDRQRLSFEEGCALLPVGRGRGDEPFDRLLADIDSPEAATVRRFAVLMQPGDYLTLPLCTDDGIAVGVVVGPASAYRYGGRWFLARPVNWLHTLDRRSFPGDLLRAWTSTWTIRRVRPASAAYMLSILETLPASTWEGPAPDRQRA